MSKQFGNRSDDSDTGVQIRPNAHDNGRPDAVGRAQLRGPSDLQDSRARRHGTARGVRFANFYTAAPTCTPARYSIFNGRHVHVHNGWSNGWPTQDGEIFLPFHPEALRLRDGYRRQTALRAEGRVIWL